jgi:hypothetical protein
MSSGEASHPPIPLHEQAPTLKLLWGHDDTAPQHHSTLQLDPEATLDTGTWAKIFSQLVQLSDLGNGSQAHLAIANDTSAHITYPHDYDWALRNTDTAIFTAIGQLMWSRGKLIGSRLFAFKFDVNRPGYLEVAREDIGATDIANPVVDLTDCVPTELPTIGHFVSTHEDSVPYRFDTYVAQPSQARQLIQLLASARKSVYASQNQELEVNLDRASNPLREALHRHYIRQKNIALAQPESLLQPSAWRWGPLMGGLNRSLIDGVIADHWNAVEAFAPPGKFSYLREDIRDAINNVDIPTNSWLKMSWDKEKFPDAFEPGDHTPTSIEPVSAEEFLGILPEEVKKDVAYWTQQGLWIMGEKIKRCVKLFPDVCDLTEEDFVQLSTANELEKMPVRMISNYDSLRSLLEAVVGVDFETYEDWVDHYTELARNYTARYEEYAPIIQQYPHPVNKVYPSLWEDINDELALLTQARKIFTTLARLPEDEPGIIVDNFKLPSDLEEVEFDDDVEGWH